MGFHPYLLGGAAGIDEAGLALAARRRLILNERCLPVGEERSSGTDFALDGGPVGSRALERVLHRAGALARRALACPPATARTHHRALGGLGVRIHHVLHG